MMERFTIYILSLLIIHFGNATTNKKFKKGTQCNEKRSLRALLHCQNTEDFYYKADVQQNYDYPPKSKGHKIIHYFHG